MTLREGDLIIEQVKVSGMANFAYIVGDRNAGEAVVIDPSFGGSRLLEKAGSLGLRITKVLLTHCHHDHVGDTSLILSKTTARSAAFGLCDNDVDIPLNDGDIIDVGALKMKVIHTPGHTQDSVCFLVGNALFTGDTLFVGECGRTDLPGSDVAKMHHSLLTTLRSLPDSLVVYPGHDYGRTPTSTLGYEKEHNYTLEQRSLEEFIQFMSEP